MQRFQPRKESEMKTARVAGTAPARVPASVALSRVLRQHVELRALLEAGLEQVRLVLAGELAALRPLRSLMALTQSTFVEHLAYEEAVILPILADDLPVGPLRMERILEEHARQIAELRALCAWRDGDDPTSLAKGFGDLARALLADIEHEERDVLTPDVIRDDAVVIDQCGG
jgi:hypothetical protein